MKKKVLNVLTNKNLYIFNGVEEPVIIPLNGINDEMDIPVPKYIKHYLSRLKPPINVQDSLEGKSDKG